jgi:hypothetical protein
VDNRGVFFARAELPWLEGCFRRRLAKPGKSARHTIILNLSVAMARVMMCSQIRILGPYPPICQLFAGIRVHDYYRTCSGRFALFLLFAAQPRIDPRK